MRAPCPEVRHLVVATPHRCASRRLVASRSVASASNPNRPIDASPTAASRCDLRCCLLPSHPLLDLPPRLVAALLRRVVGVFVPSRALVRAVAAQSRTRRRTGQLPLR